MIECSSCGYATSDDLARRGRIQKCGQCSKVLYIPSGLYRIPPAAGKLVYSHAPRHSLSWWVRDRMGAKLNRFSRSKARLPLALLLVLIGVVLVGGLFFVKNQTPKGPVVPSDLAVYYNKVLDMNKSLKQAEVEFDRGAGGTPNETDFADRTSLNNQKRFVRATDRMLKQVEGYLYDVYAMENAVPAGAESHYTRLKAKLEERQRFYARLKDGIDQKNQDRWKEAFANRNLVRDTSVAEEQALSQLQAVVIIPAQANKTN